MSLATKIREQLISTFRAELAEHIQTMTDGLLALEQGRVADEERQSTLRNVFRAAHSLKGAARAVGVTVIEQLAHALEDLLNAMQHDPSTGSGHRAIELTPELFTACYRALDAIQAVQAAYESGETTPPVLALQALADLGSFRTSAPQPLDPSVNSGRRPSTSSGQGEVGTRQARDGASSGPGPHPQVAQGAGEGDEPSVAAAPQSPEPVTCPEHDRREGPALDEPVEPILADAPQLHASTPIPSARNDETIRVSVSKLDALMAQLSELLVTKIRAEQRLAQVRELQEFMTGLVGLWGWIRGKHVRADLTADTTPVL